MLEKTSNIVSFQAKRGRSGVFTVACSNLETCIHHEWRFP